MPKLRRLLRLGLVLLLLGTVLGLSALGVLYWLIAPTLPSVEVLRDVRLQVPMSVYSRDDKLVAQFGETRRYPVTAEQIPAVVKQAFIATEDEHFYEHPGVEWRGVVRAVWLLATTSGRVPGGSTITQQVAKMFFLSPEYSYRRKLTEMFVALRMEQVLSKDEILGLYLNKSFFGNRAYGVAAAAEFYYGKTLDQLSLEEAAMLATIPKFPSSGNPIVNPRRAMERRNYVLDRMAEVGYISAEQAAAAKAEPDRAHPHEPPIELEAPYVAEMVRQEVVSRLGEQAMADGVQVWTTLDSRLQDAANRATRTGVLAYDRRHGWRGVEGHVELPAEDTPDAFATALHGYHSISGLLPAVVLATTDAAATLGLADGQTIDLPLEAMKWARRYQSENSRGPAPGKPADLLTRGDVVRVMRSDDSGDWTLAQLPKIQGALVSLDSENGAIRALTGGFSFSQSKFNRATQAQRQPGSSFKPFIYAAAFERGFTPASIVLDAPVVFDDTGSGQVWQPHNDNERFAGPMRLREAMVSSRNLVSIRLIDAIGVPYAHRYVQAFGFPPESLPEVPSLALGSASEAPLTMARAYATFANGGFLIDPYFIDRITDRDGNVLYQAEPVRACRDCPERLAEAAAGGHGPDEGFDLGGAPATAPAADATTDGAARQTRLAPRAVDERTAYLVHSLLRDVARRGTGALAGRELKRPDIGGKTGTTNDHRDGWFSGFGGTLIATSWMGLDDFSSMGNGEFASRTALPIWVEFMRIALEGVEPKLPPMPDGIATATIDPDSGRIAAAGTPGAISEIFKVEDLRRLEARGTEAEQEQEKEAYDIF